MTTKEKEKQLEILRNSYLMYEKSKVDTKKKRNDDRYSPGGKAGFRPDRPVIVYTNLAIKTIPPSFNL